MATISDMAFDYAMQRGHGRKSDEHFVAGAKAVIREVQKAFNIGGIDAVIEQLNSYIEELK